MTAEMEVKQDDGLITLVEAAADLLESYDRDSRLVGYHADRWECLRACVEAAALTPTVVDGIEAAARACQTWAAGFINQGADKARFLRLCAHDLRRNQAEIVAAHIQKGKDND